MKKLFTIEGMHCAACSASVERVVKRIDGVTRADVNLVAKTLITEYDETRVQPSAIIAAVEKAGFEAIEIKKTEKRTTAQPVVQVEKGAYPSVVTRLIVSFCLLIPLMYLSMGNMFGWPIPNFLKPTTSPTLFAFTQMLLALPVLIVNRRMFVGGVRAVWHKSPNMDTLVTTGSGAAFLFGIFAIYMIGVGESRGDTAMVSRYVGNLYFESSAMILALITVGKALEERAKNKTGSAVEGLKQLAPDTARILVDGVEKEIATADIDIGDIVIVKDGESVPVDGIIVSGGAYLNEAALTGESVPVYKTVGAKVMSATLVSEGFLHISATAVGGDTVLSQIIDLVQEAGATKAPIAKLADKISGVFVPTVMAIALITLIIWLAIGRSFETAFSHAISVLVISCPCALGLATPVAVTASVGASARRGILIKKAEAFEILAKTNVVIFDKTGTVTEGKPEVNGVITADGIDESEVLTIALSLEEKSAHPLAVAAVEYCKKKVTSADVGDYLSVAGKGVTGIIDGKKRYAGNESYLIESGVDTAALSELAKKTAADGNSLIWVASDGAAIGVLSLADKVKDGAANAVDLLKKDKITVAILSGDNEAVCEAVKKQIGVDTAYSGVLPDGKEKTVADVQTAGKTVAFVGDGINDSPALARADLGIAVGGGTSIAIDAADVVLMKDDIAAVADCVKTGRRTVKNIKENLFWAFFYNVICIPLAAGAFSSLGVNLNPMIAAAAMSVSSLFVVCNSLRLTINKKGK